MISCKSPNHVELGWAHLFPRAQERSLAHPVPGLYMLALCQAQPRLRAEQWSLPPRLLVGGCGKLLPQEAQGLTAVDTATRMKGSPIPTCIFKPPTFPTVPMSSPQAEDSVRLCPGAVASLAAQCRPDGDPFPAQAEEGPSVSEISAGMWGVLHLGLPAKLQTPWPFASL